MKSLRFMVVTSILSLTVIGSMLFFVIANSYSEKCLSGQIETDFVSITQSVNASIQTAVDNSFDFMEKISTMEIMQDPDETMHKKQDQLDAISNRNKEDLVGFNITDLDGNSRTRENGDQSFASKVYVQNALKGKTSIVGPVVNTVSGALTLIYGAPVKDANGNIISTMFLAKKGDVLCDICSSIRIGQTGYPIVIDRTSGNIIGDMDKSNVLNFANIEEQAQDTGNQTLIDVVKAMKDGETGIQYYNIGGVKKLISYAPVPGTNWAIALKAPFSEFDGPIKAMKKVLMLVSFGLIIFGLVIATYVGKSIRPLSKVSSAITEIASGNADLTQRLSIKKAKKEITEVVDGFNNFIKKLFDIVTNLKQSKETLKTVDVKLQLSTQDASASITEIVANIESVNRQIVSQTSAVHETASAVNEISSNIESLDKMIEYQSEGVSQASSAVEEMIGNINSVNNAVEKVVGSFTTLQQNTSDGIAIQNNANQKILQIDEQSKTLQDANAAIANIAEQTNLLAMNAAIEAAHAGEAGKGFSVVADEIRKLSETSSAQSKTISQELTKIQESIALVVEASSDTNRAFSSVSTSIDQTSQLVEQIRAAMEEQQIGSKQIIDALQEMNNSTTDVRAAAQKMTEGNRQIQNQIQSLQTVSDSINDSIGEMQIGAEKMNQTGANLSDISQKVTSSIKQIGDEIDLFRV